MDGSNGENVDEGAAPLDDESAIAAQTEFFRKNLSGCAFAAYAARSADGFGWAQICATVDSKRVDFILDEAISNPKTSTLSIIFPSVKSRHDLLELWSALQNCRNLSSEDDFIWNGVRCLRLRAQIGELTSWVSGFGPFEFFPITRRSPCVEIAIRVKPRPAYPWVAKAAPDGVIHLADMDMLGLPDDDFWNLWEASHARTEKLLGGRPDELSAARTTFSIPIAEHP